MVKTVNDEKILIPVKYPEYADNLVSMATMMRNPKLKRELVALNVVYDDVNMRRNQSGKDNNSWSIYSILQVLQMCP